MGNCVEMCDDGAGGAVGTGCPPFLPQPVSPPGPASTAPFVEPTHWIGRWGGVVQGLGVESPENRPWVMSMSWHDLLFAHWRVEPAALRRHLPDGLDLDLRDGAAWLGVVPFRMSGVRPRGFPAMGGVSAFPELNLRTYVVRDGRPGVWFFSLDAASRVAVRVARATFHLPYFDARMECRVDPGGRVSYRSRRVHRGVAGAEFEGEYGPVGEPFAAQAGSLEHWLTERYCLYAADARGTVRRGDIAHEPWPLQRAEAEIRKCDMTRLVGLELSGEPAHLLFARRVDVRAWWPVRVD